MRFWFEDATIELAFSFVFWQLAYNNKEGGRLKHKPHIPQNKKTAKIQSHKIGGKAASSSGGETGSCARTQSENGTVQSSKPNKRCF